MIKGVTLDPGYYDEESSNQIQEVLQEIVGEVEHDCFTEREGGGGGVADFLVLGISFLTVGGFTIECVVGMSDSVNDRSAVNFSYSFYQALAYGRNVSTAFDLGCLQIDLKKLPSSEVPRLLTRTENSAELAFDKR